MTLIAAAAVCLLQLTVVVQRALCTDFFCQAQDANDVDWFLVYKMPKMEGRDIGGATTFADGHGFLFMNSAAPGQWSRSAIAISANDQMVQRTLAPYYAGPNGNNLLRIMYSGSKVRLPLCHVNPSEGLLLSQGNAAMWMVHSVKNFPPSGAYAWPAGTATDNGQMIMCLSLNPASLPALVETMAYEQPYIYISFLPAAFQVAPYTDLLNGVEPSNGQWKQTTITTNGQALSLIYIGTKPGSNMDILDNMIKQSYRSHVASWTKTTTPTDCKPFYKTYNITGGVRLAQANNIYELTRDIDDSMWIVTQTGGFPLWCIVNYPGQRSTRSGSSALCTTSGLLYQPFHTIEAMATKNKCP